jgi:5-methyltetrahydropteroyltriglutamate--homocysteine methyltransferase
MRRSSERILTTHAGSLPRPEHLTSLFVRRARGEGVDPIAIAQAGREALRAIVPLQASAGIDVGNNGEQQHDSFFLYLGPSDEAWRTGSAVARGRGPISRIQEAMARADVEYVPCLAERGIAHGDRGVHYIDPAIIDAECRDFGMSSLKIPMSSSRLS